MGVVAKMENGNVEKVKFKKMMKYKNKLLDSYIENMKDNKI